MQIESKHKKITDLNKPFEYPVVESGYLDIRKLSNNTELQEDINDPRKTLKYPVVVRGYLCSIDQSKNTEIQEGQKDSLCHQIIWSCVFVLFIFAIIGYVQSSSGVLGLFIILMIFLAMLFFRIIQK